MENQNPPFEFVASEDEAFAEEGNEISLVLSGLGDWVKEQVLEREVARQTVFEFAPVDATIPKEDTTDGAWPFLEVAALQVWFEPEMLRSFDGRFLSEAAEESRRVFDFHCREVRDDGNRPHCALRDESRRSVLKRMWDEGVLDKRHEEHCQLRQHAPEAPSWADEPLQKAFDLALQQVFASRTDPAFNVEASPEWLEAVVRVLGWCQDTSPRFPDVSALHGRLEQEELVQPLRALVGRWDENGRFVEHFRGRRRELDALYDYIGIAPPSSLKSRVSQALRRIANFHQKPLQLIYGVGGTGKSTLLAKLVLDHFRAAQHDQFPWVYLDCDRNTLRSGQPMALLSEALDQLGVQFSSAREQFRAQREKWEARLQNAFERPIAFEEHLLAVEEFARLYEVVALPGRPLLFVLDTFEEVQHFDAERVQQIFDCLGELLKRVPLLRVVVAGRAPVEKTTTPINAIRLESLDEEAALGFLQSQGIQNEETARRLVKIAGGHPLSLRLIVSLSRQPNGIEEIEEVGKQSPQSRWSLFRSPEGVQRQLIQGQLFKRILWHIHDPDVRKLAHPGLLLRRITPAVVEEFLGELCEVEVPDAQRAMELFAALRREVFLVTPSADAIQPFITPTEASVILTLRFREELRQQVLPLVIADNPEQASALHRRAIEFYSASPQVEARAEELYHRLWDNSPRKEMEARWSAQCLPSLLSALEEEIPPRMHVYLAVKAKREATITQDEWLQADLEDWETYAARRAHEMLRRGRIEAALELLSQRHERSPQSSLPLIEALIWENAGQIARARTVARKGVEEFKRANDLFPEPDAAKSAVSDWLNLLLALARLEEKSGFLLEAANSLQSGVDGAERASVAPWLRLQLGVSLLRVQKLLAISRTSEANMERTQELVLDFFWPLAQKKTVSLRQNHQRLLHEMLWVLGHAALKHVAGVASGVLELCDLPPLSAQRQAALAEVIAAWDEAASEDYASGIVEQIVQQNSATSTQKEELLRDWLGTHSSAVISGALRRLLQEHPLPPSLEEPLARAAFVPEESEARNVYNWESDPATMLAIEEDEQHP